MVFIDTRLPVGIEKGASGGPVFNTTVHKLASGYEQRNQNWAHPLGRWDVSYGIRNKTDTVDGLNTIVQFFYNMRGKANSFRFRDWLDYSVEDEVIEQRGDNTTREFQLTKGYTTTLLHGGSASTYYRRITKPSEDIELEMSTNGTNWGPIPVTFQVTNNQSANSNYFAKTGRLILAAAPPLNTLIRWSGEFENHVRFDTDSLSVSLETVQAGDIPDIPIVELRS